MTGLEIDSRDRITILIHYYRAMVGRADIWRTRMDTTTNWAIGSVAAVISFSLGNPTLPHYVVFVASIMTAIFLMLEARRLTFYHLWQQRVLLLEDGLIRPAVASIGSESTEAVGPEAVDLSRQLEQHLGRTAPSMPIRKAAARRLRRVYLYLFGVQLLAWVLKLSYHPTAVSSIDAIVSRARIGAIPGPAVVAVVTLLFVALIVLALGLGGIDRTKRRAEEP